MINGSQVLLGQYRPLDSFLHGLDARAKIVPVLLVLILALFTQSYLFYLSILTILIAALLQSGISKRKLFDCFKPILWLVAVTVLFHLIFSGKQSEVLFTILSYEFTENALHYAAFYSLRLVLFVSIAFLITLTSSPSDLADSLTKLLNPLKRFRFPVDDIALILFIAIRFIPVLYEEYTIIKNAQILRGVNFGGSIFNRIRKSTSIVLPVFVGAIGRADELAQAIENRGYGKHQSRTCYSRKSFGFNETVFATGSVTIILGLFYVT
jgi:energy-coupling factor transport system permease protein